MTEEQKQLLMKDLCGRLPYGVKCKIKMWEGYDVCTIYNINSIGFVEIVEDSDTNGINVEKIKPYLFPLSSMTNEQMEKIEDILIGHNPYMVFDFLTYGDIVFRQANVSVKAFAELIQFFDKEMLDYRGLIEQGLAIDATDLNIYINKEE